MQKPLIILLLTFVSNFLVAGSASYSLILKNPEISNNVNNEVNAEFIIIDNLSGEVTAKIIDLTYVKEVHKDYKLCYKVRVDYYPKSNFFMYWQTILKAPHRSHKYTTIMNFSFYRGEWPFKGTELPRKTTVRKIRGSMYTFFSDSDHDVYAEINRARDILELFNSIEKFLVHSVDPNKTVTRELLEKLAKHTTDTEQLYEGNYTSPKMTRIKVDRPYYTEKYFHDYGIHHILIRNKSKQIFLVEDKRKSEIENTLKKLHTLGFNQTLHVKHPERFARLLELAFKLQRDNNIIIDKYEYTSDSGGYISFCGSISDTESLKAIANK